MGKLRVSRVIANPEGRTYTRLSPQSRNLINLLYQRKVLDTKQLTHLTSPQGTFQYDAVKARLRTLMNGDYIVAPTMQRVDKFDTESFKPVLRFIGNASVELLQTYGYNLADNDYSRDGKSRVSPWHDWWISEIHVRFFLASQKRGVEHLPLKEFIASCVSEKVLQKFPFSCPYTPSGWRLAQMKTDLGLLKPDDIFGYIATRLNAEMKPVEKKYLFFLEVDRDTERNDTASAQTKKTIKKMLLSYMHVYEKQLFASHYGVDNMRVLFVTSSHRHINEIMKILEKLPTRPNIFWFATFEEVKNCEDIYSLKWRTQTQHYSIL